MTTSARSRAIAGGELVPVAPRTLALPWAVDDVSPLAAILLAYPAAVASHRAAAWLWHLDGVDGSPPNGAAPTESELETRYLQVLRDHGVPLPLRQYRVFHQAGSSGASATPTRT